MITVFVAGSIAIKKVHLLFIERLAYIVSSEFNILVGDADGADSSIQQTLFDLEAKKVTVYCTGSRPRNNIGSWNIRTVASDAKPGTRKFFTAKDLEMAGAADFGLMLWDTKSTGTLSNVLELLRLSRKSIVFINKSRQFIKIKSVEDLGILISTMSEAARYKAEGKIGLVKKVEALRNLQFELT